MLLSLVYTVSVFIFLLKQIHYKVNNTVPPDSIIFYSLTVKLHTES